MVIWSGGGECYARNWADKLGLKARVIAKASVRVDIAFDDMEVDLGDKNIQV